MQSILAGGIGFFLWAGPLMVSAYGGEERPAAAMSEAAGRFLAALDSDQKAKATFALGVEERRNWHFIPRDRAGLAWKEMTPAQQHLAVGLLGSALSQDGLLQATTIMSLEAVLRELEQGNGPVRDPQLYYVSIFGSPSENGTWGWRIEGHHLSLNFTLVDGNTITVTPSFFGANPGEVRSGPRSGLRALAEEEDLARELVRSFSPAQRERAVVSETAPREVILQPGNRFSRLEPEGLPAIAMTPDQAELLDFLLDQFVRRYRRELADLELHRIHQAGPEKIFFAWAGSIEPRRPHYYRIQGPTFALEYDNTQNNANHIHTVWHDAENDFGEDALRDHYRKSHASR